MMSGHRDNKFTVQGADPPVPVGVAGERAGPAQPSATDCSVPSVGNQAEGDTRVTGRGCGSGGGSDNGEGGEMAFNRSRKIARTPPPGKQRTNLEDGEAPSMNSKKTATKDRNKEGKIIRLVSSDDDASDEEDLIMESNGMKKKNSEKLLKHSRLNIFSQLKRCNFVEGKKRKILDTSIGIEYSRETKKREGIVATDTLEAIEMVIRWTKELEARISENPNKKGDKRNCIQDEEKCGGSCQE